MTLHYSEICSIDWHEGQKVITYLGIKISKSPGEIISINFKTKFEKSKSILHFGYKETLQISVVFYFLWGNAHPD